MKRSKNYLEKKGKTDRSGEFSPAEAMKLTIDSSISKFAGSVEVEVQLSLNQKQKSDSIRGTVQLPNQFGKVTKVLAIVDPANIKFAKSADISGGEELVKDIEDGKIDFDVVIATPAMMPKIARLGKTLGKKGLMPNPKNGTVTTDVEKAIEKFKSGQKSFKLMQESKINLVIGKTDMGAEKLEENFQAFMTVIRDITKKYGPSVLKSIRVKPTMGPSLLVKVSE
jgi:large subunit ribosomal protein L1